MHIAGNVLPKNETFLAREQCTYTGQHAEMCFRQRAATNIVLNIEKCNLPLAV